MAYDDIKPRKHEDNAFYRFAQGVTKIIDGPVIWFRETVVEPNRKDYNWYHQEYRRVPTVDQCYTDDLVCRFEADQQFKRDRQVDCSILSVLRNRFEECALFEGQERKKTICAPLFKTYEDALENWFIKYGDLGGLGNSTDALMKQKHRMVWERRYGPVGTGKIPLAEREAQAQKAI